jgi:hypothetical protein
MKPYFLTSRIAASAHRRLGLLHPEPIDEARMLSRCGEKRVSALARGRMGRSISLSQLLVPLHPLDLHPMLETDVEVEAKSKQCFRVLWGVELRFGSIGR